LPAFSDLAGLRRGFQNLCQTAATAGYNREMVRHKFTTNSKARTFILTNARSVNWARPEELLTIKQIPLVGRRLYPRVRRHESSRARLTERGINISQQIA
jgi:hypothetical protein